MPKPSKKRAASGDCRFVGDSLFPIYDACCKIARLVWVLSEPGTYVADTVFGEYKVTTNYSRRWFQLTSPWACLLGMDGDSRFIRVFGAQTREEAFQMAEAEYLNRLSGTVFPVEKVGSLAELSGKEKAIVSRRKKHGA